MLVDFIVLFFAFNFNVPFLRRRASDMLIPTPTSSRIQYTPNRAWLYYNILLCFCKYFVQCAFNDKTKPTQLSGFDG